LTAAKHRDLWLLAPVLLLALLPRLPTLAQPLLEKHPFRQTWTAYTALIYHEKGIDLFHPELPVFGQPFFHPQEFPLFQALAATIMQFGVGTDQAMRVAALLCFFATAGLVFGLARHVAGRTAGWAALIFFVASPFALVWSRASMIEYLATAGCVAWMWAGIRFREERTWGLLAIAIVAGSLGALVKPTTAAFCVMPIALYRVHGESGDVRAWLRARLDPRVILLLVVPGVLAIAWTGMAELYFQSKPAAAFLAPSNLRDYHLGLSFGRLDGETWGVIWSRFAFLLVGVTFVPLLGVAIIAARRQRTAFWVGVAAAIALPIFVFYGGYRHHDYYIAALAPEVALLLGLGAAWLIRGAARRGRGWLVGLFAGAVLAFAGAFAATIDYWPPIYAPVHDNEHVLPAAREMAALSRSDDLVVMIGRGWDPDVLYYARRKGLLLTGENATRELVATLPSQPYRIFFSWDPATDPITILWFWAWSGAAGPRTYEVGGDARALEQSAVLATSDRPAFNAAAAGARRLVSSPIDMPCDGVGRSLPVDPLGAWLLVQADPGARVSLDALAGPLPVRPVYVITPKAIRGGSSVSVSCIGPGSMTIESVIAAPPPGR
jgi:hypothetical protein